MSKNINEQKIHNWATKLGKLPGVAAIFLSGSIAQGRGHKNSDIDFFIIANPGQIWTARFFVFVTLKINRMLAKPKHHAGKICPNHFITSDHLEIVEKDDYSAHLFSHNQAVYDPENIFAAFAETNRWVQDFGQQFETAVGTDCIGPNKRAENISPLQKCVEFILKHLQTWVTKQNPEYKTPGAKIILSDTELRFHPVPKNKSWTK